MTQGKIIKIPIKGRVEDYEIGFRFYNWEDSDGYFFKSFSVEEAINLIIKHLKIEIEIVPATQEQVKITSKESNNV